MKYLFSKLINQKNETSEIGTGLAKVSNLDKSKTKKKIEKCINGMSSV